MIDRKLSILQIDKNYIELEPVFERLRVAGHEIISTDTFADGPSLFNVLQKELDLIILEPNKHEQDLSGSVEFLTYLRVHNYPSKKVLIFTVEERKDAKKTIAPHKLSDYNYLEKRIGVLPSNFTELVYKLTRYNKP